MSFHRACVFLFFSDFAVLGPWIFFFAAFSTLFGAYRGWPRDHKRSVRLIVDEGMELDALTIVKSLPDFQDHITGVVPMFGGKCFDITLDTPEHASLLAHAGFDYDHTVKPL